MEILNTGASFNIDENSVPHTLKCVWHGSVNFSYVHVFLNLLFMNQTMYIATWDSQMVLVTKPYSHCAIEILSNGISFNIDENSVPNSLKCVWLGL